MRVLFVLSQRPELTGSGVTLDALVRESTAAGHEAFVLCGVPSGDPVPAVGGLHPAHVATVSFGPGGDLPYAVPGMSDVMPYESTVWSTMSAERLTSYREVWSARLADVVTRVRPDLVHLNHLWLVSSIAPRVLGAIPSVVHGHATGLRQMELCPPLRDEVVGGLRIHRGFVVLHEEHADRTARALGVGRERVRVVGAGYRTDVFGAAETVPAAERRGHLLFVGKYSAAKGLPWLLDACEVRWERGEDFVLHVAGDGSGPEAEQLRTRMQSQERIVLHGRLDQRELADLMRRSATLVLPSLYEGLPLVLAEARACGCSLVSTALEGVVDVIAPVLGDALTLVPLPRRNGPDRVDSRDERSFVRDLIRAIDEALGRVTEPAPTHSLEPFTWHAVFRRVESFWEDVMASGKDAP